MDYVARLRDDRFVIFLFHGVIEEQPHRVRNYTRKHLTKDYFAAVLRQLRQAGTPVSMDQILEAHRSGRPLPPRSFAITFDDGFENNLSVAAPVMADLDIPGTFYITTDFVTHNRMSWIDRIEWAMETHGGATLKLPWDTMSFDATPQSAIKVLNSIRSHVKSDPSIVPDDFATMVQMQLGHAQPVFSSHDPVDKKMSWTEVHDLARGPGFTIGCHTRTHAILSFLSPSDLASEVGGALAILKQCGGIATHHFSYPEGLAHCYSPAVIEALKASDIAICPTAEDGDNDVSTDPFLLRRVMGL